MSDVMFHVMRRKDRLAIFRMGMDGSRSIFLPGRKSLEQVWPGYDTGLAAHLDLWFEQRAGVVVQGVQPGEAAYPRALTCAFTRGQLLKLWAYVTPPAIFVSLNQIAHALGRNPISVLRANLQRKGLRFNDGRVLLPSVARILGETTADSILLYPNQAAAHLGVSAKSAAKIVKRFGISTCRDDTALVSWGNLRRVRRVGPRKFELTE